MTTRLEHDEWLDASALEQARAIRERQISSEELVRGYLARIERQNPALGAFVEVAFRRAPQRARAKDGAHAQARRLADVSWRADRHQRHGLGARLRGSLRRALAALPVAAVRRLHRAQRFSS
jgi:hypothetical protein